jgi:hypothetical protein
MPAVEAALASRFARIALDNVVREYPNKLDHVLDGPDGVRSPRALHPAFYGSFDWHSCVHMHWLLARLHRRGLPEHDAIEAVLDAHLGPSAIAGEVRYLERPSASTFERTYGWAWLLKLALELRGGDDGSPRARWSTALQPLADAFVARYLDYLPRAAHPLRAGMHANSAFGLAFALDYARTAGETALAGRCEATARAWFLADRDYPAAWEPSGSDFLSPALMEADLMRRVLGATEFPDWLGEFLPGLARGAPAALFTPAVPTDRSDGQIVHLDGLNLSRAWCLRGLAGALPVRDVRHTRLAAAAEVHLAAGMQGIDSGHYMGEHWLASFAMLAIDGS